MRIADGSDHPPGHGPGVHPQLGVDRHHDHVELLQQLRFLVQRAVLQDVALDAGEQPERRPARVQLRDHRQLLAQPRGRQPTGHGQPWRVVGERGPFVPQLGRRPSHLLDRAASVGPVRVCVTVPADQRPQPGPGPLGAGRRPGLLLQFPQVAGHLTAQRLPHHLRGLRPDPLQRLQRPRGGPLGHLALGQRGQRPGGGTEGPYPVGGRERPLQKERDPVEGGDGVHENQGCRRRPGGARGTARPAAPPAPRDLPCPPWRVRLPPPPPGTA